MINDELEYGGTYTTVEELKKAEQRYKRRLINWEVWNKLVIKLREELKDIPTMEHKVYKVKQPVYVYSTNYKFIGKWPTTVQLSKDLGITYSTIHRYLNEGRLFKKRGMRFYSYDITKKHPIDETVYSKPPRQKKTNRTNRTTIPRKLYVYDKNYNLLGEYDSFREAIKTHDISFTTVYKYLDKDDYFEKKELRFLTNKRLLAIDEKPT